MYEEGVYKVYSLGLKFGGMLGNVLGGVDWLKFIKFFFYLIKLRKCEINILICLCLVYFVWCELYVFVLSFDWVNLLIVFVVIGWIKGDY